MKRTHKLKGLKDIDGVMARAQSVAAAATHLGVDRSTVHRWIEAGKVPRPGGMTPPAIAGAVVAHAETSTPAEWATWVRETYVLPQTDLMLLDLAMRALTLARDEALSAFVRMAATARYQQLVKQLNLNQEVSRVAAPDLPVRKRLAAVGDPRAFLQAVK